MSQDLFIIKPANQWLAEAAKTPAPKLLFGDFWLEGELSVLFSDAGKGKSILGVQIAESIARGRPISPVPMTAKPRKVLYFDFEQSSDQFEMRYSADPSERDQFLKNPYSFPKNFQRVEPDIPRRLPEEYKTLEEHFLASIEAAIRASRAKVVVIDSIYWLQGERCTARHTVPLMRTLKRLKSSLDLSILILAHNPRRDTSRALAISGLQGAGVMCNFADSVFAIGQSRVDSSLRYLKHIKSRSTELVCDEKNVLVGEIRKWETNFLSFRFHRFSPESDHLAREINPMVRERVELVQNKYDEGMTQREIAADLGLSLGSVNRYLQMAQETEDYSDLNDDFFPDDDDEEDEGNDKDKDANSNSDPADISMADAVREFNEDPRAYYLKRYGRTADDPFGLRHLAELSQLGQLGRLGQLEDDDDDGEDEDPMARYGLAGIDKELAELRELGQLAEPGELGQLNELGQLDRLGQLDKLENGLGQLDRLGQLGRLPYKTLDDKIDIGDIVQDDNGRLMKRTVWGWDRCADSL